MSAAVLALAPPPPAASRHPYIVFRWALAVVALALLGIAGYQIFQVRENFTKFAGNAQISTVPYNDPTKAAVAQKLEGAKGLFQVTMLVLAVLWGLLIAKKEDRTLLFSRAHAPEVVMFCVANAVFIASFYCYAEYTNAMSYVHKQSLIDLDEPNNLTIMDFRDSRIDGFYVWQTRIWAIAMAITGLALFSAYGLIPAKKDSA